MVENKIKVLTFKEVEFNEKGIILSVLDEKLFGTPEFKEKVCEELSYIVHVEDEEDLSIMAEFDDVVEKVASGNSAEYLDYWFEYIEVDAYK